MKVAALYVEPAGCYVGAPDVDPWDEARDARQYAGPWPVVAHPPCQRWGRFWHGSTRKPHQYQLGDDGGCFEAALHAVLKWSGVLEHPAHSRAWDVFGLRKPKAGAGWQRSDMGHPSSGYWVCYVEQGHYGHASRKPTWLLANVSNPPELSWTKGEQRLPAWMVERYGYEKARRIGVVAMVGGKNKTAIRNATPPPISATCCWPSPDPSTSQRLRAPPPENRMPTLFREPRARWAPVEGALLLLAFALYWVAEKLSLVEPFE